MHIIDAQLTDAEVETMTTLFKDELERIDAASNMVRVTDLEKRVYRLQTVLLNSIATRLGLDVA